MTEASLTVLVENTAPAGLLAEHGLSVWIEYGDKRVLFDTGQGKLLCGNARRLGVALASADVIVLSHGHYDHIGGLGDALRIADRPTVYVHRAALEPKYSRSADGKVREIGIKTLDEQSIRARAELVWSDDAIEVFPGLHLTGPIPRESGFEDTGGSFFCDEHCTKPDELADDQAAFIETSVGTVVVLGCAHSGVVNTLWRVRSLTGGQPIHTVVGGMHLINASDDRIGKTISELRKLDVQRLMPCHCTGQAAIARLWREFPGRCEVCQAGTVLQLPQ